MRTSLLFLFIIVPISFALAETTTLQIPERFTVTNGVIQVNGTPFFPRGLWNAFQNSSVFGACLYDEPRREIIESPATLGIPSYCSVAPASTQEAAQISECRRRKACSQTRNLSSLGFNVTFANFKLNDVLTREIVIGIDRWNRVAPSMDRRFFIFFSVQGFLYDVNKNWVGNQAGLLTAVDQFKAFVNNPEQKLSGYAGILFGDESEDVKGYPAPAQLPNVGAYFADLQRIIKLPEHDPDHLTFLDLHMNILPTDPNLQQAEAKVAQYFPVMKLGAETVPSLKRAADIIAYQHHYYHLPSRPANYVNAWNGELYAERLATRVNCLANRIATLSNGTAANVCSATKPSNVVRGATAFMGVNHSFGNFVVAQVPNTPEVEEHGTWKPPSAEQYRSIAYSWIIGGANGLIPFSNFQASLPPPQDPNSGPANWKIDAAAPPSWPAGGEFGSPALWQQMVRTNIELIQIGPILASGITIPVKTTKLNIRVASIGTKVVIVLMNPSTTENVSETLLFPLSSTVYERSAQAVTPVLNDPNANSFALTDQGGLLQMSGVASTLRPQEVRLFMIDRN